MCSLVQVHEIHVDLAPWQIFVELSMELQQWFVQLCQRWDPHFGWREGVHPHHHTHALLRVIGIASNGRDFIQCRAGWFQYNFQRQAGFFVQLVSNDLGMISHLFQRFRAIQMLATDDKPNF